jgi:hypothetical protein
MACPEGLEIVCGTFETPGACRIYQIRQKLLTRLFLGEDLLKLRAHGLPVLVHMLRWRRMAGRLLRDPSQALAPERVLGQAMLEKREEVEGNDGHDPHGQVNRGGLGLGDVPPARRDVEPIGRWQGFGSKTH